MPKSAHIFYFYIQILFLFFFKFKLFILIFITSSKRNVFLLNQDFNQHLIVMFYKENFYVDSIGKSSYRFCTYHIKRLCRVDVKLPFTVYVLHKSGVGHG